MYMIVFPLENLGVIPNSEHSVTMEYLLSLLYILLLGFRLFNFSFRIVI